MVWSDLNSPEVWESGLIDETDGTTSEAGYIDVYSANRWHAEAIHEIALLRDLYYIYTGASILVAQYIGLPLVWTLRIVNPSLGVVANTVGALGNVHIFLGNDWMVYAFNGVDVQPIGAPIRKYLLDTIAFRQGRHVGLRARVLRNPNRYLLWYPRNDDPLGWLAYPSEGLEYNLETGAWSPPLDLPFTSIDTIQTSAFQVEYAPSSWDSDGESFASDTTDWAHIEEVGGGEWDDDDETWDSDTTTWDGVDTANFRELMWTDAMGDSDGFVYRTMGWTKAGADYVAWADTKLFDLEDSLVVKAWLGVQAAITKMPAGTRIVDATTAASFEVELWYSAKMGYGEPDVWTQAGTFTLGPDGYGDEEVDFVRQARYMKFRFKVTSTAASKKAFSVSTFVQFIVPRGLS